MRRAVITVLTLLAVSWTSHLAAQVPSPPPGSVPIRSIRLTLDPVTYSGPCPVRLRAHVVFESNYPARVDEDDWGWNFGRLAPHSWDVPGGHLRPPDGRPRSTRRSRSRMRAKAAASCTKDPSS